MPGTWRVNAWMEKGVKSAKILLNYRVAWNFPGSHFCFSNDMQKKFPQIKITTNIFPAKIYSRVNILWRKYTTQKYSTKKTCLFNNKLSLSYRNKTVYNEKLVSNRMHTSLQVLIKKLYSYCTFSIKVKILSTLATGYILKIAKTKFPARRKNKSVLITKISSCKMKKIAKPQKFRVTRYFAY